MVWDRIKDGLDGAREQVGKASSAAQRKLGDMQRWSQESAQHWAQVFSGAEQPGDPRFLDAFALGLGSLERQLDSRAPAVAVGMFRQAGVGLTQLDGMKLTYVRPDGPMRAHLRVSRLYGRAAHLAAGVGGTTFAACLYGERSALLDPAPWQGGDAGFWVASIGLFRAKAERQTTAGWLMGVGVGVGVGVPILSEIGGFRFEESVQDALPLTTPQSQPIERALTNSPDCKLRRGLAQRLIR